MESGKSSTGMAAGPRRTGKLVCSVLTFVVFLVLVVVFIVWVTLQPHKPKYYLDRVSVSHFNVTEGGYVGTALDVDMSTRNPNKRIGIYYDEILSYLLYDHDQIGWGTMPAFYQPHKNTTALKTTLASQAIKMPSEHAKDLRLEQGSGSMDLHVIVEARARFKVGSWKSEHYLIKVKCRHVSLPSSGDIFPKKKCAVYVRR